MINGTRLLFSVILSFALTLCLAVAILDTLTVHITPKLNQTASSEIEIDLSSVSVSQNSKVPDDKKKQQIEPKKKQELAKQPPTREERLSKLSKLFKDVNETKYNQIRVKKPSVVITKQDLKKASNIEVLTVDTKIDYQKHIDSKTSLKSASQLLSTPQTAKVVGSKKTVSFSSFEGTINDEYLTGVKELVDSSVILSQDDADKHASFMFTILADGTFTYRTVAISDGTNGIFYQKIKAGLDRLQQEGFPAPPRTIGRLRIDFKTEME